MEPEFEGMWQCPKCGERFVTKNMAHSCGKFELKALFSHSEPHVFELYKKFVNLVQSIGPVRIIPQKTRIAFQVRVRFAGIMPRKSYLVGSFWFTRRHNHPRFWKIEKYAPRAFGHYFRIESEDDLDEQLTNWIHEVYEVGQQKHLGKQKPD
ncbi:MAG: DUF5655 domain-containing protein [Candidatus Heimdallarchaeota archaeon]